MSKIFALMNRARNTGIPLCRHKSVSKDSECHTANPYQMLFWRGRVFVENNFEFFEICLLCIQWSDGLYAWFSVLSPPFWVVSTHYCCYYCCGQRSSCLPSSPRRQRRRRAWLLFRLWKGDPTLRLCWNPQTSLTTLNTTLWVSDAALVHGMRCWI